MAKRSGQPSAAVETDEAPVETPEVEQAAAEPEVAAVESPEPPKAPSKPTQPEEVAPIKPEGLKVRNMQCRGLKLFGTTGQLVEFDEDGIATCQAADYEHFLKVPGFEAAK